MMELKELIQLKTISTDKKCKKSKTNELDLYITGIDHDCVFQISEETDEPLKVFNILNLLRTIKNLNCNYHVIILAI